MLAHKGPAAYESQEMLHRYLLMHFGTAEELAHGVPVGLPPAVHLPLRCAELVCHYAREKHRALDLGCAVGRATFELAREFRDVRGIDYSREFIAAATQLRQYGRLDYWQKNSGADGQLRTAFAPGVDYARISFQQGDATALPASLHGFDAVLLANVLCRLPDPAACLSRMDRLVAPGGVLVMATPFSWLPEYTPRERWINGIGGVAALLPEFDLLYTEDLPFLIREHARKFEYIVTLASVWRRK